MQMFKIYEFLMRLGTLDNKLFIGKVERELSFIDELPK